MKKILLSEFDAAQLVKISPTLLRWFTTYAAKDDGRKLKCTKTDGIYYYEEEELLDFNTYLHLPWKKPTNGQRPTVPAGITNEIKTESHYRCPICNTNAGEVAHIKPVSKTLDNHPHNLIYLCPNHHTLYDFGYKVNNIEETDIIIHKNAIQSFQSARWSLQSQTVFGYLSLIHTIGRIKELESVLLNVDSQPEFEKLLSSILDKFKLLTKNKPSSNINKIIESATPANSSSSSETAYSLLSVKEEIESEYRSNNQVIPCPVCQRKGFTSLYDTCPACAGEGYIDKDITIDFSAFIEQDCPLCNGKGRTDYFDVCPPCGGEGRITKERVDSTDFSDYDLADCPVCKGRGRTDYFEECPPCGGDGKLTKETIANTDFSVFELQNCPLCKGRGQTNNYDSCPACSGEGKLTTQQIENTDFSDY